LHVGILYIFKLQTTVNSGCSNDLEIVYLYALGRPAKNPEHPLTRLRKALSTPTQEMTRALFSKRVGIPEPTIKAIETGKFKLSDKNAAQIASVTKVDPKCLMDPSLPLTDYMGFPLDGYPVAALFGEEFLDIKALLDTAFEVAEAKQKQAVFSFLFQRWLEETSEILGLGPGITNKLQEKYPIQCFGAIPEYFWPKDQKKRKEVDKHVKRFQKELTAEITKALSPPEETTPGKMSLEQLDREETAKLNPEEATTDPEAFLERWQKAQEVALERYFKVLAERSRKSTHRFLESYADVAWDLRKKMIEEAKSSHQKQPKR
jgi:DNA-binding XRE family transcriptional regulator